MPSIRPTKLAHIVYRTRRYDEMLRWYETVFDAKIQYQNPALAFLTFDDEHHRFAFVNMAVFQPDGTETDRQGAIGVDHAGYTYASLSDLLETYARLKAEGIVPYWSIHHGFTAALYYADPDGNQMEFQIDCCNSSEEASAFMHGPRFAANPLGVEFEPEKWLARLRAGTTAREILAQQPHEPASPLRGAISKLVAAN